MIRWLNRLQPWGVLLMRLVLGFAMAWHGWQKVVSHGFSLHHPLAGAQHVAHSVTSLGLPYWLGYVSVATEALGGLFLLFGLLTRITALFVTINMLVALFFVNIHQGYSGSEYSLALIALALMLLLAGPGTLALDRRLHIS